MIRPSTDLPLSDDPASRYLPWTVGLLVFLATLSLAAGMILSSAGENWRRSISGTLTIQVPAGPDQQTSAQSAIDLLRATPGVDSVRRISDGEVATMLEPWLGAQVSTLDLPMPVLIDATVDSGKSIDIEALSTRLSAVAPGTVVDEHAVWLRRLTDLAAIAETVSLSVMVFVLISAVMTVVFTTRTGLAIHSDVVEVLHLIGAHDSYIARQFQVHTLWLAGIGAAAGFALGAGAILVLQIYGARLSGGLLPDIALSGLQWGVLCLMPVAAVLLVVATVGVTVRRVLGRLM
ncbi:MAG: hypothetical protein EBU57_00435 [Alphaproteobacteria bacterium]|jgi:cell division transport system permease protein|nr:hypothetical protein [Alphaproteobacteria bacterium]